jgi:hypothetical protein
MALVIPSATFQEAMSSMSSKWIRRLPALTGAVFGIAGFVRGGGDDAAPTASATGAQIAAYAHNHGLPGSTYNIELWVYLSLMVFTLVVYSRLRAAEPREAVAAKVAVAACVMAVAIKLGSYPAVYALYSSPTLLDAGVARPLWILGEFAFTVSMLVMSLSMLAIGFSGLLHGGIPRWLAATAGAIGIALVIGFTLGGNFLTAPTIAWIGWTLVAGVTLYLSGPRTADAAEHSPARLATSTAV